MKKEIEIRDFIGTLESFQSTLKNIEEKFGAPKLKRRLSIVSGDYKLRSPETRLRVTNKKITLAQKKGDVGAITRGEIEIDLDITAEDFYEMALLINNLSELTPEPYCVVMQHENYLFETSDYEIKLFKQFGKGDLYAYEIETTADSIDDLIAKAKELGLEYRGNYDDDSIIRERNVNINWPFNELSEEQLKMIINTYF